ncbi:MAG: DUF2179 domain-containing protein [Bacteroidota bacterium]
MSIFGELQNSAAFAWVILPLLIFFARITDQSIGTLRLIFLSKGFRTLAPMLGFFEVIIWLLAVSQIMKHLDNFMCYIAYGSGFAMGNYLGMMLDQKLSIGNVLIRSILRKENLELIEYLNDNNFGLTVVDGEGARGKVKVLFSIVKRKDAPTFVKILREYEPNAFYTVEDVKTTNEGVFRGNTKRPLFNMMTFSLMKSK